MKIKRLIQRQFSQTIHLQIAKPELHNLQGQDYDLHTTTTPEELIQYYRKMVEIRRFELIADQYYKEKKIFGFCHLYDGQEACAVGLDSAL